MKRSKKNFVRLLLKFAKRYFPQKLYSLILFLRSFRKFKKEINKKYIHARYRFRRNYNGY